MSKPPKRAKKPEIVCLCNGVPRDCIESAIREGADTLNKIFDCTMAGVGACGGSCRRKLAPMLDAYLISGEFPAILKEDNSDKKKQA